MIRVTIEKLPNTRGIAGAKRWEEERGAFVQIAYREEMRHLAIFEIKKGFSRGNHFHKEKEEVFYVFHGKIRATFLDMDTLAREAKILEKGHRIRVESRCGHVFQAEEDTLIVEYSPQFFDPGDNFKINLDQ